jgi:hypothetical protein
MDFKAFVGDTSFRQLDISSTVQGGRLLFKQIIIYELAY